MPFTKTIDLAAPINNMMVPRKGQWVREGDSPAYQYGIKSIPCPLEATRKALTAAILEDRRVPSHSVPKRLAMAIGTALIVSGTSIISLFN